ncbi:MAG: outer membrane protein assembly factor BamA [Alphaproteobacteria bacterium]|nr:outer membrane protein assembly factor BamA [Alphaproteobacteria bacterium]
MQGPKITLKGALRACLTAALLAVPAAISGVSNPFLAVPAAAQQQEIIQEIRVEGAQRIDPSTVVSYLVVEPGDAFNARTIDRSLKRLFATGLFADVSFQKDGGALVVRVVENPIINRIAFEGAQRVTAADLESEISLRPRVVYTRTKIQNDVQRIIDIYRQSGRFGVTVEPKIIQLPQNRIDVVFEIDEGSRTKIRRITFIGNRAHSDGALRDVISTKESAFYRFLSTADAYDPDRLTFDRELLRRYYLSDGYADFKTVSAVAELAPDREAFFITFTVEEGLRYRFGETTIETTLPDFDPETLRESIEYEPDDVYDADAIEEAIQQMVDELGNLGYAFVDIEPQITRNADDQTIDIVFQVREGPRVFVEAININGNVRTHDRVIRREFRVAEGDAFNAAKLRRSETRIRNLGFFADVRVDRRQGSVTDRTVIDVNVEEQSTGEISFGIGFSSADSVLGNVSLRERNLLGLGKDIRVNFSLSTRVQQFDVSYTEPYFLERDVAAGIDVFNFARDQQDESSFDIERTGFGLRARYRLTEHLSQSVGYGLRQVTISDVGPDASVFVQEQEGETVVSSITQRLTYDRRDSARDPSSGYILRLENEFAGLGGDAFVSTEVSAGYYIPIAEDYVLGFNGQVGHVFGYNGDNVGISNRFFIGGQSLRGFEESGIGPRVFNSGDPTRDDALGGNTFYTGSVELQFPLGLSDELGLTGLAFVDAGSLFDVETSTVGSTVPPGLTTPDEILDESSIRLAGGVGLVWRSPLGPLRLEFSEAILKEDFDQTETFRFSFGTRF